MNLRVQCQTTLETFAPLAAAWERLSCGMPFRSHAWLGAWWRQYGQPNHARQLLVPCVFDDDILVAAAPCFVEQSAAGRSIAMLGTGEVCSEYLGVLCRDDVLEPATDALAEWFTGLAHAVAPVNMVCGHRWDVLHMAAVDPQDRATSRLADRLAALGNRVDRGLGHACWRIDLPDSWDDYLAQLSKSHRRQVRRLEREFVGSGRAVLHTAGNPCDLRTALEHLIRMHQARRWTLGEPGCFASRPFTAFLREATFSMAAAGQVQLCWLKLDGRPVAADYYLHGGGVTYAYQGGVAPEALHAGPGSLLTLAVLRQAIERGDRAFDFLRGDEPYKAHWRAAARPCLDLRVIPRRPVARLRHGLWQAGRRLKGWLKTNLRPAGKPPAELFPATANVRGKSCRCGN